MKIYFIIIITPLLFRNLEGKHQIYKRRKPVKHLGNGLQKNLKNQINQEATKLVDDDLAKHYIGKLSNHRLTALVDPTDDPTSDFDGFYLNVDQVIDTAAESLSKKILKWLSRLFHRIF